ncbi:hypothetical protein ACFQL3_12920 [Natronoarchaeum sp. GCM10025321]
MAPIRPTVDLTLLKRHLLALPILKQCAVLSGPPNGETGPYSCMHCWQ